MSPYQRLFYAQTKGHQLSSWLEMALIIFGSLLVSYHIKPDDPFFYHESFPWPIVAPVLVAARYGFFMGFISFLCFGATCMVCVRIGIYEDIRDFYSYLLGLSILCMVIGEFRDYWQRQIDQLTLKNSYRQLRLDEFTKFYHLLKVSHDRLEQQSAGASKSLRQAIDDVRSVILEHSEGLTEKSARAILKIMTEYGNLQSALIAPYDEKRGLGQPLATIGDLTQLDSDDFLVQVCLENRTLCSIDLDLVQTYGDAKTDLLVTIPIVDSSRTLWAMLVIKSMPFFALREKTLKLLNVIAGHLADLMHYSSNVDLDEPDSARSQLQYWLVNLNRSLTDRVLFDVPSALIIFKCSIELMEPRVLTFVRQLQRGLDLQHEYRQENTVVISTLLPLTDELGLTGYQQRVEARARTEFGKTMEEMGVIYRSLEIENVDGLIKFLRENHLDAEVFVDFLSVAA